MRGGTVSELRGEDRELSSFTLVLDRDGLIRHADSGFAMLVERSMSDLVGANVGFVLRPDPTFPRPGEIGYGERTRAEAIRSDGSVADVILLAQRVDVDAHEVRIVRVELADDDSQRRVRRVPETPVLGIAIVDPNGLVIESNATFRAILGVADTARSRTFTVPELAREAFTGSDGKSVMTLPFIRPDGSRRRLAAWNQPLDRDQTVRRISLLDETERRNESRALRESDRRFRSTFEQAAVGLAHVALDGTFLRVNDHVCDILGYSRRDLTRIKFSDLTFPEERAVDLGAARELIVGVRDRFAREKRYIRKDGSILWAYLTTTCVRDERGRAEYFFSVIQDISDRKRAELERENAASLLRATLEATVDGVVATDLEERFVGCNGAFLRMWNVEVPTDRESGRILHAPRIADSVAHQAAYFASLDDLYEHPEVDGFDVLELVDGRVIERHSRPQRVGEATIGRVFSFRDVSDRVRAELGLKRFREQTIEAQKMEAVGRLAGGIAHDFNNLLTIISSYSQLLLSGRLKEAAGHDALAEILRASDRAAALTKQLLAYGRKQILDPVPVALNSALESAERSVSRLLGSEIALVLELDPRGPIVSADPTQFDQVLMNLVVNAKDAMPEGGRVVCSTGVERIDPSRALDLGDIEPGLYGVLSIRDTGHGMSEDVLSRVFEPFFTTKDPGKGTGLGLATVFGIVRQSGGAIAIESKLSVGTLVRVYLPASDAVPKGHSSVHPDTLRSGSETILVVEDSDSVRRLTRAVLESFGYSVVEAPDAKTALHHFATKPSATIQAVVTDVIMPGMNGRELASRFRESYPGLPVLLLSGFHDAIAATESDQLGDFPFLAKPFSPEELAGRVRALLDARPQRPDSKPAAKADSDRAAKADSDRARKLDPKR